jgi:hypothetical protein
MIPLQWTAGILNHLWQSTIFAVAAGARVAQKSRSRPLPAVDAGFG